MKTSSRTVMAASLGWMAVRSTDARATGANMDACELTTNGALRSCKLGARSDAQLALGKCVNIADGAARSLCGKQASSDGSDALLTCKEQDRLRRAVCERLGDTTCDPVISPANFVATIDNPYFSLPPGDSTMM